MIKRTLFLTLCFSMFTLIFHSCNNKVNALNTKKKIENINTKKNIELEIEEFKYLPSNLSDCNCFLSLNKEQFQKGKYILINDFIVTSYANINGVETKFVMTYYDNLKNGFSVATYKNMNLEMKIELNHDKFDKKFGAKTGKITIKSKDGRMVEKEFYGECKCK